mmetsp:Transcript_57897/g.152070  ORF Transcript_57897/g.152070 Transcript_57897/m.152070 type:complete len:231 (-) Transcript_57897:276-968(-)
MSWQKSPLPPWVTMFSPAEKWCRLTAAAILPTWSSVKVSKRRTPRMRFSLCSRMREHVTNVSATIRSALVSVRHVMRAGRGSLRSKPRSPKNGVRPGEYLIVCFHSHVPAKRMPGIRIDATTSPLSMTQQSWPSSPSSYTISPALNDLTCSAAAAASISASPISEKSATLLTISWYFSMLLAISAVISLSRASRAGSAAPPDCSLPVPRVMVPSRHQIDGDANAAAAAVG